MKIETKYNLGDDVWVLFCEKAIMMKVGRINISNIDITEEGIHGIDYVLIDGNGERMRVSEKNVYSSKKELAKAIGL